MQDLFIELLQVSLGSREGLSMVPSSKEWEELFEESARQAVSGIAFNGVQKWPETQRPPQMLLFEWIGVSEQIRQQNLVVDKQTREIWNQLKKDGLDAAILKGQGIATLYGELAPYRQSGDIDIGSGGRKGVYEKPQPILLRAKVLIV